MNMTTGRVTKVELLRPTIKRITWEQDSGLAWSPGQKIKVRVADGVMRSYTLSGSMELIAHIHGAGAGSTWADALEPGDTFSFKGPARSFPIDLDVPKPWAMFFGDETTLGLCQVLRGRGLVGRVLGAVELEPGAVGVLEAMGLELEALERSASRGDALAAYAQGVEFPEGEGVFWLSGEADSVVAVRRVLLERGIERRRMCIKSYWSARGKARRKQLDLQMSLT